MQVQVKVRRQNHLSVWSDRWMCAGLGVAGKDIFCLEIS